MDTKKIKLTSVASGEFAIEVDHPLVNMSTGDTLKFRNKLTGDPEVTIDFFFVVDEVKTPAIDLCSAMADGTNTIKIPGGEKKKCKIESDGYIKYDISADKHTSLDPVVIIDNFQVKFLTLQSSVDQLTTVANANLARIENIEDNSSTGFDGITLAGVALVALIAGYLIGKK